MGCHYIFVQIGIWACNVYFHFHPIRTLHTNSQMYTGSSISWHTLHECTNTIAHPADMKIMELSSCRKLLLPKLTQHNVSLDASGYYYKSFLYVYGCSACHFCNTSNQFGNKTLGDHIKFIYRSLGHTFKPTICQLYCWHQSYCHTLSMY